MTDIEIAKNVKLEKIEDIAKKLNMLILKIFNNSSCCFSIFSLSNGSLKYIDISPFVFKLL